MPERTASRFAFAVLFAASLLPFSSAVHAQVVRGRVTDAETGEGVPDTRLVLRSPTGRSEGSTRSDDTGAFVIPVSTGGDYVLEVFNSAYAERDPMAVHVEDEQEVELAIRLSRSVMEIEPLQVVARRRDPRHDATWDGVLAREERFPDIGSRRVIMKDDVEMRNSSTVGGVLRQMMPAPRSCLIYYWNGNLVTTFDAEIADLTWLDDLTINLEAVEYYRYYSDAPHGMRGIPPYVDGSPNNCSVVALWPALEPPPKRMPGWLRLLGGAAAAALIFFVIG